MKNYLIAILSIGICLTACKKEIKQGLASDVEGKVVDFIDHYTIHFKDGAIFHMSEKEVDKIYYLIRHAEKDTIPVGNPKLTDAGLERATRLAEILDKTQIDALYSTMYTRTLYTVDSLADAKGLVTFPYQAKDFKDLAVSLDKSIDQHKVVIVGHSNSIPVLANHLYGKQGFNRAFEESDYDNFIIVLDNVDSTKQLLKLKY